MSENVKTEISFYFVALESHTEGLCLYEHVVLSYFCNMAKKVPSKNWNALTPAKSRASELCD